MNIFQKQRMQVCMFSHTFKYVSLMDTIYIEPWRAKAFPVIKDLIVDRSAFDRIQQAGGYISVAFKNTLAFLIIILVLLVRPEGLLGKEFKERV